MKKSLEVEVGSNTDELQLKLRTIARNTEALADELDAIDNAWQCDYGSDSCQEDKWNNVRTCLKCGEKIHYSPSSALWMTKKKCTIRVIGRKRIRCFISRCHRMPKHYYVLLQNNTVSSTMIHSDMKNL